MGPPTGALATGDSPRSTVNVQLPPPQMSGPTCRRISLLCDSSSCADESPARRNSRRRGQCAVISHAHRDPLRNMDPVRKWCSAASPTSQAVDRVQQIPNILSVHYTPSSTGGVLADVSTRSSSAFSMSVDQTGSSACGKIHKYGIVPVCCLTAENADVVSGCPGRFSCLCRTTTPLQTLTKKTLPHNGQSIIPFPRACSVAVIKHHQALGSAP